MSDQENRKRELRNNINGAYDYRYETIVKIENEKINGKNNHTIEILENKILTINKYITEYKKELSILDSDIQKQDDINEQIEDIELAINTAYGIKSVYKSEIEHEFLKSEDEINYDLIVSNQKNIDALENTIKDMEKKLSDLQKILFSQKDENNYIFKGIGDNNFYHNDKYDDLDIFDDDYDSYKAWALDELYNEDGSY
jgi:prefoldin subunit 5